MTVEIWGLVVARGTQRPRVGLRVQAWDEAAREPRGEGLSDERGAFVIVVDGGDNATGYFFRVYRDDVLLASTEGAVVWLPEQPDVRLVIEVEESRNPVPPVRGRLLGADGEPLPGRIVELRREAGSDDDAVVGTFLCDEQGEFVAYLDQVRGLSATVRAATDGSLLGNARPSLRGDVLLVSSNLAPDERPDPPLTAAAEVLGLALPDDYLAGLADAGVWTLGGLGRAPDELVAPDGAPEDVLRLRAAAGLRTLSTDLGLTGELLAQGYGSVAAVARAPRARFAEGMRARLDDAGADALHVSARAQNAFLVNVIAGEQAELTRRAGRNGERLLSAPVDGACACEDCRSAVSPVAYLADLLRYAVDHVKDNGQDITLTRLTDLTLQPLQTLPLDCNATQPRVRRIRIVVEVLRAHLAREWATIPQERRDVLAQAEREYVIATYLRLLAEHGTSFDELRSARLASAAEREQLAQRLGVDLHLPDPLDALFLDPDPAASQLTEAALEQLFGYKSTTTNPLADPPAGMLTDRRIQRLRQRWLAEDHPGDEYSFEREDQRLPVIDPDLVQPVDFRDQNPLGNNCFTLYNARRTWVDTRLAQHQQELESNGIESALEQVLGQPLPDLDGLLTDLGGSGAAAAAAQTAIEGMGLTVPALLRVMTIRAKDGASDPADQPTEEELRELLAILTQAEKVREFPGWIQDEHNRDVRLNFQRFRLVAPGRVPERAWIGPRASRIAWQEALRRRAALPVVEPDLVGPVDFGDPLPSGPLHQLWSNRRQFVEARVTQYRKGARTLGEHDNHVMTVLDEMSKADWLRLIDRYEAGEQLTELLETYTITRPELGYLVKLRQVLAAAQPVIDPEWNEAAAILAQVEKRRQFPLWRSQERQEEIAIGPDAFVLSGSGTVKPPRRRGTMAERTTWQDTLRARIEEDTAVTAAAAAAIAAAEADTLPLLRDALVAATDAAGADATERADSLGDRLLIDVRAGSCDLTTRIAQAIESIQVLLFSLRTAQLEDTHPDLALDADHFDEEWAWIGSYTTWRAAMFVFLMPENLALPSLRRHQTYGFRRLVSALRSTPRATPEAAAEQVRAYLRYFDDVCALRIVANAVAGTSTGPGNSREHSYLFAQSKLAGATVYWSRHDAAEPTGRAQTSWAPVNSLTGVNVREVVGACPTRLAGERWLYLFVRIFDAGEHKLAFTRLNLEHAPPLPQLQDAGWEELQKLSAPDGATQFQTVLVQNHMAEWPQLAILTGDRRFSLRRVVGSDWERGDWLFRDLDPRLDAKTAGAPNHADIKELLSVVAASAEQTHGHMIFARYANDQAWLLYQPSNRWNAGSHGVVSARPMSARVQRWQGAFLLDDTSQAPNPTYYKSGTARVYGFWFDGFVSRYQVFGMSSSWTQGLFSIAQSTNSLLGDADGYLAVVGGNASPEQTLGSRVMVAYHRGAPFSGEGWNEPGLYLASVGRLDTDSVLFESDRRVIAPRANAADVLTISEYQRDASRQHLVGNLLLNLRYWWDRGANALPSNRDYLEEAYGFVPLHVALTLQQRREYTAALDWFRVVYDYSAPLDERKIYPGLVDEETFGFGYTRASDWLLDTMNPHAVAATRRASYIRFTLLGLVRCLLEFGDDLFTTDTGEAIARARVVYGTALELLDLPELAQEVDGCAALIGKLDVTVGGPEWVPILHRWATELLALGNHDAIESAIATINSELRADRPWEERVTAARTVLDRSLDASPAPLPAPQTLADEARLREVAQRDALRDGAVEATLLDIDATYRMSIVGDGNVAMTLSGYYAPPPSFSFCVPPNPLQHTLRLWAEMNLFKIRTCRNIAGLERELEAYAAPADTSSGLPAIGSAWQLSLPAAKTHRPTAYRYHVLIARARELAELARQVEASMLAAIQAGDLERYNRLRAGQDLTIGQAGVRLQDVRAREADGGLRLAELSKQRAALTVTHYDELLGEGPTATELAALITLGSAAAFHTFAAAASASSALIHGALAGAYAAGGAAPLVARELAASSTSVASAASSTAAGLSTVSSLLSMQASFERRAQEWEFQRALASHDVTIGDQQINVAGDRVRVVAQEREIAKLQSQNAEQMIDFLDNKFTNTDLYDFMADELERVYRFFLEQAASIAQLAASQLAFERQEDPPAYIRADYWLPSDDVPLAGGEKQSGNPVNRRGLTGSARLLGDIGQLDAYAFETDRRKLHLTTTLSLAQLAPVEFARFRQSGELRFDTPGEWFDRQFPGHYLRLVRRVRLSIVALIPPNTGIRATLAHSGPSYVVIGGPTFSRVKVHSFSFDEVALSSPYSDTGVFELDPQPQMRFPFEGIGVDTRWTLRLPRPANPFDFQTIADVLMTIEYTALSDANLRTQVIAGLSPVTDATLPLSLRYHYPDQWYDLHNRHDRTPPFRITFELPRSALPPNLTSVQMSHVALLLSHKSGGLEAPVTIDLLGRELSTGVVGTGATTSSTGLASSRTNAQGWNSLPRDPVGEWVLQFKDEELTHDLFDEGGLNDILLVLTVTGHDPAWV